MTLKELILITVVAAASALELTPHLCLSGAAGTACRCTYSLTELGVHVCDVECSSRNISVLPTELQISLEVRSFDLSRNQLFSLTNEQFSHWGNLEELNLSRNKFTSLNEGAFLGLANLRTLDLSYNMLTILPDKIFNGLSNLSTLNLEMNRLQELHPQLFSSTPRLDSLILSYNTDLGTNLMKSAVSLIMLLQRNLSSLFLNNMSIKKLPDGLFNEAGHLRHLSLADNPLKIIHILPASLESLNLSGIEVEALLPGDFISYPKLRKLQLDRLVHLRSIEENAFEGLTSLDVLTMENCIRLSEFHEFAFGGPNSAPVPLKQLSLARSGLHTLSSKTFLSLVPTLERLALQGNPWQCDCRILWIRQTSFSLESTEYLRCFSPEKHRNERLLSVDAKEFTCSHDPAKQNTYSEVYTSIILDVFMLSMVLLVTGTILTVLWRRGFILCTPRKKVGSYSQVTTPPPNSTDLEWDDKDLNYIWTTPSADIENIRRGN